MIYTPFFYVFPCSSLFYCPPWLSSNLLIFMQIRLCIYYTQSQINRSNNLTKYWLIQYLSKWINVDILIRSSINSYAWSWFWFLPRCSNNPRLWVCLRWVTIAKESPELWYLVLCRRSNREGSELKRCNHCFSFWFWGGGPGLLHWCSDREGELGWYWRGNL